MRADPAYTSEAGADVDALGFDPYAGTGRLGERFTSGVHDPVSPNYKPRRARHEIEAAGLIAREGADVRLCKEDHTRQGQMCIDSYVRWSSTDTGTGTELKSLTNSQNTSRALKAGILKGSKQLSAQVGQTRGLANGHVLIDARGREVTAEQALDACRMSVGQANIHRQVLPTQTIIVLDDDSMCVFRPRVESGQNDGVRYVRPDDTSFRRVTRRDGQWDRVWRGE